MDMLTRKENGSVTVSLDCKVFEEIIEEGNVYFYSGSVLRFRCYM